MSEATPRSSEPPPDPVGEGASGRAGAPASGGSRPLALAIWLALGAGTIAAYWPLLTFDPREGVLRATTGLEGALFDPTGEDPRLICALAAWMLLTRRGPVAAAWRAGAGQPLVGGALLAAAAAVHGWAAYVGAPDLLIHSLQLLVLGAAALLGGPAGLRAVLLPVAFLLLAVPIPAALLNALLLPLQLATVDVCTAVLRLFGVEAWGFGDQILTSRGAFHVIETCSGVRLMQTLVMAAVVYGELFGRGTRRTLLLLAIAPGVGLLVNLARILSIIFNPYASISSVHTTQGVAMVVVGVLLLAGIDHGIERRRPTPRRERGPSAPLLAVRPDRCVAAVGCAIAALLAVWAWVPRWELAADPVDVGLLPREIDGRRSNGTSPDLVFLGSVHFSKRISRVYSEGPISVGGEGRPGDFHVFFGTDDHLSRRGSLLSGKTAYPGRAWERRATAEAELSDGTPVEVALFAEPEAVRLVVHWREDVGPVWIEALRGFAGLDRSRFRRSERAFVWRISTEVASADEIGDAQASLLRFAQAARNAWLEKRANVRSSR